MKSKTLYAMTLLLLAACGHETPLIAPKDIPAYEQKRREKFEKYAPYNDHGTAIDAPANPEQPVQKEY